jgi:hypothetical protein
MPRWRFLLPMSWKFSNPCHELAFCSYHMSRICWLKVRPHVTNMPSSLSRIKPSSKSPMFDIQCYSILSALKYQISLWFTRRFKHVRVQWWERDVLSSPVYLNRSFFSQELNSLFNFHLYISCLCSWDSMLIGRTIGRL